MPFQTNVYEVNFLISVPPINNAGDLLTFTGVVAIDQPDAFTDDNSATLIQTVVNSYDPNDITVHQGEFISPSQVNDFLHYTIRFQNVGTAEAVNIRVENALSEYLDWNSLSILAASADYQAQRQNGLLTFRFDNINLPGSDNEPEIHGFITYKIKPLLPFNNPILNSADIYFDFNEPIYTNTVSTSVQSLGTGASGINQMSIYPNPATTAFSIDLPDGVQNATVAVYELQGKLVLVEEVQSTDGVGNVDVSGLEKGLYLIRLSSDKLFQTAKLMIR